MVRSLLAAACLTAVAADPVDDAFAAFKHQFGKTYNDPEEEFSRKNTFKDNWEWIQAFNAAGQKWRTGVNQFADLTVAEWSATYKGATPPEYRAEDLPYLGELEEQAELASSIDWTRRGAVTPVKDQGQCGSCWSFSTTGAAEGAHQIASGRLVSLAEQQLVDCDTHLGDAGCNGGWPYNALTYLSRQGACNENSYPYRATGGSCKRNSCSVALNAGVVTGYHSVGQTDNALMSALNNRPVSITVNAEGSDFQFYKTGVMTTACTGNIDHAVLATGYGTWTDGTPYWRVKNSWSSTWGDAGYFNMMRGNGQLGSLCVFQYAGVTAKISSAVTV